MKLLITFSILLFVGITAAFPFKSGEDDIDTITTDFYPDSYVKYQGEHDIVKILVPMNSLNFDENDSKSSEEEAEVTLFFVEADVDEDGKRTYQGLYIFKNGKATKILENGRDAAAANDGSKKVYFAAQDGIYEYKSETNEAVKYGSVTDSVIGIAKPNVTDIIYILTEEHEVYKVTDAGNTKNKLDEVVNAQEIVLDYSNNIYFYAQDKKPYVLTATGLKEIEGIPSNPTKVNLLKPPFIIEDGVPFVVDNAAYIIYANGSSEAVGIEFGPNSRPTAFAMEGTLLQYYGYNKKIYEYNLLAMVLGEVIDQFKEFLEEKSSAIQSLASQKKGNKV